MTDRAPNTDPLSRVIGETLYSRQQIDDRIQDMAGGLQEIYKGKNPLFVGVALGGVIFARNLTAAIHCQDPDFDFDLSYITADTYPERHMFAGQAEIISNFRPVDRAKGRNVVLLTDVIGKGTVAKGVVDHASSRDPRPKTVNLVTLVRTVVPGQLGPAPIMSGFGALDAPLVGEGMHWHGMGRNLGRIAVIDQEAAKEVERELAWL